MINLFNRTEYSFKVAYGPLGKVLDANPDSILGICDRNGTWGHVPFEKTCKKAKKKAILGVELALVEDAKLEDKQGVAWVKFIAKTNIGLRQIYELTSAATQHFYYMPRIDISLIAKYLTSEDVICVINTKIDSLLDKRFIKVPLYVEVNPATTRDTVNWAINSQIPPIASSDNYYPRPEHKEVYEVCIGKFHEDKATAMHILNEHEWDFSVDLPDDYKKEALANTVKVAEMCRAELPQATLVKPKVDKTLLKMCEDAAEERGVDLNDPVYRQRLDREIALIDEKKFEDYFFVISDMVIYAKKHMLVGPARGSSCGSLVCYLLHITDIDPIPYDLIFERFIDINREDLPDIDIDFPDDKREMVIEYLRETYGKDCVSQLGTVLRFKAKSTIAAVAKELNIPAYEVNDLKDAILERSGGDARSAFCILDTFNELEIGKKVLIKYPELAIAADIENHASHSGTHAAGILVTELPVYNYCSVDAHAGATQVDKYDAESLNLLKIDALGLRTLSLINDCLEQVGMTPKQLLNWPRDDKKAFKILNDAKFTGIFQFEGSALQSLTHQLHVEYFEDIVSLTALARPGPLNCGGAAEFLKRRMGQKAVEYLHPMTEKITKVTHGVVIYQEQVMQIAREVGRLSWEDVSQLRKAMSKSLGREFFDGFYKRFEVGAKENGLTSPQAQNIWDNINTMGSWAFNRSHAVAYGLVSYWCCVLKAYHPLEYAAACLRHPKDDSQIIWTLRELVNEGFTYKAFDKDKSLETWSVQDGNLVGGLTGIKGIGAKKAKQILDRRASGQPMTKQMTKFLEGGITPYDSLYECMDRYKDYFENPTAHKINSPLTFLKDISQEDEGEFVFIAKLKKKDLRDLNETHFLQKREGRVAEGQTLFLNITVEDDTGEIICNVDKYKYLKYGKPIVEEGKIGEYYIFKGKQRKNFRRIYLDRWVKL